MDLKIWGAVLIFAMFLSVTVSANAKHTDPDPQNEVAKLICPLRPLPPSVGLSTKTIFEIVSWRKDMTANVLALREQRTWIVDNDGPDTPKNKAKRFLERFLTTTHYRVQWAVQLEIAKANRNRNQVSTLEAVARQTTLVRMVRNASLKKWQDRVCRNTHKKPNL